MNATHEVLNQPPPLGEYNLFERDAVVESALAREGASWARERLCAFGERAGRDALFEAGVLANRFPPVLRTHDRSGYRVDAIDFHPAWHDLMRTAVAHGLHSLPWRETRPGAHVARAALFYTMSQVEAGHGCPISMTYSAVPAMRVQSEIAREWEPRLTSLEYDPRALPAASKLGSLCGMAMTEKQGGSDVRANTTRAEAAGRGGPGGEYAITGHKWFCSAPMSDAFLLLAHSAKGLSCFLMPRFLPDGTRNRIAIQRLKDKLGNRSNASGEVEFEGAWARMVGEEGRGVATIIEMVNHTRLDCVIGVAACLRQALVQALHHCRHRSAFGRLLVDQPLMQNVLADLCLEWQAATMAMMRLARSYDDGARDSSQRHFARLATAVVKYWVCKRAPTFVAEALECLGGGGYVEESPLPRLYREAPLNGVWEGSGNVICLDILRALRREPESLDAFFAEIDLASGANRHFDRFTGALRAVLANAESMDTRARRIAEEMALALQGSLMLRFAAGEAAEAFCASRLGGESGRAFGGLDHRTAFRRIIDSAWPGD